jgi:hypothetical protein
MIVVLLWLWAALRADVPRDELVRNHLCFDLLWHKPNAHPSGTTNLGTDTGADGIFNATDVLYCPHGGHSKFQVDEIVLAGLNTGYVSNLDLMALADLDEALADMLADGLAHLFVNAAISQLI